MTKTMGEHRRSFRIVSSSFGLDGGRYIAEHPLDAGKKAGRMLFMKAQEKRLTSRANNQVVLELSEITKSKKVAHSKERYFYKVTRKSIPVAERKEQKFKKADGSTISVTPEHTYEVSAVAEKDFPADHRG